MQCNTAAASVCGPGTGRVSGITFQPDPLACVRQIFYREWVAEHNRFWQGSSRFHWSDFLSCNISPRAVLGHVQGSSSVAVPQGCESWKGEAALSGNLAVSPPPLKKENTHRHSHPACSQAFTSGAGSARPRFLPRPPHHPAEACPKGRLDRGVPAKKTNMFPNSGLF